MHLDLSKRSLLHPDVPKLHWTSLHYRSLCASWKCLQHYSTSAAPGCVRTTGAFAASGCVYNTIAPQLHLDVSGQQEPLLLLDVSTLQSHEKHLKVQYLDNRSLFCLCSSPMYLYTLGPKRCLVVSSVYTTWCTISKQMTVVFTFKSQ